MTNWPAGKTSTKAPGLDVKLKGGQDAPRAFDTQTGFTPPSGECARPSTITPNRFHEYSPKANWRGIPDYMRPGLVCWFELGIRPGSFLMAVLENDLCRAATRADRKNISKLSNYGRFLLEYAPPESFGSPEICNSWFDRGGLTGIRAAEQFVADFGKLIR